ncbi:MAG: hypothetical protein ACKO4Y_08850 [Flavobacteriales bacterium]
MNFNYLVLGAGIALLTLNCSVKKPKKKTKHTTKTELSKSKPNYDSIRIDDKGLIGYFRGPEYNEDGDIAHQFSNKVAERVGVYLKERYSKKVYLKVDLAAVRIKTQGLNQVDSVYYAIEMPFKRVTKCDAFTGIEHCGSWNYQPILLLNKRFKELREGLSERCSVGNSAYQFYKNEEGFQEYWIQFKHKDYQADCVKQ